MPRRAVYVTGWVAVTTAATVIGLGAVGVVRGAVQGNDTVTALSQQQVTEQLQSVAPAGAAGTTAPGAASRSTAPGGSQQRTATPSQPHTAAPSQPATIAPPSAPSHPTSTTTSPEVKSSPSPTRTEQSTATATSTPTSSYQAFTSAGGTVFARCTSGNQVSGTATPNNGYSVGEQELGPDSSIKVEFIGNNTKIVVQVTCSGGTATSSIQTESGD